MRSRSAPLVLCAVLAACSDAPPSPMLPGSPSAARSPDGATWSTAAPISELNTPAATEGCPNLASSDHVLLFASNRPGGFGGLDLYESRWDPHARRWSEPVNLGSAVNTAANEQCPLLLAGADELIFVSNRPGGAGGLDLYAVPFERRHGDVAWGAVDNLSSLNTTADEFGPGGYRHGSETVLYFNSNRPGGAGGHDLYSSTRPNRGVFSSPSAVAALNTAAQEQFPALSEDGLEIFFASDRPGTLGGLDLWRAVRADRSGTWGAAENLGPAVNSSYVEGRSTISHDGRTLIFHSNRAGSVDLFVSERSRSHR